MDRNRLDNYIIKNKVGQARLGPYQRPLNGVLPGPRNFTPLPNIVGNRRYPDGNEHLQHHHQENVFPSFNQTNSFVHSNTYNNSAAIVDGSAQYAGYENETDFGYKMDTTNNFSGAVEMSEQNHRQANYMERQPHTPYNVYFSEPFEMKHSVGSVGSVSSRSGVRSNYAVNSPLQVAPPPIFQQQPRIHTLMQPSCSPRFGSESGLSLQHLRINEQRLDNSFGQGIGHDERVAHPNMQSPRSNLSKLTTFIPETAIDKTEKAMSTSFKLATTTATPKQTPKSEPDSRHDDDAAKQRTPGVLTSTIENALKMAKAYPSSNNMFEIFGRCINVRNGSIRCEKLILIRDQTGPVMQVSYFEVDGKLQGVSPGVLLRVIGVMAAHNRLRAFKVRPADAAEQQVVNRLYAVGHYTARKVLAKK